MKVQKILHDHKKTTIRVITSCWYYLGIISAFMNDIVLSQKMISSYCIVIKGSHFFTHMMKEEMNLKLILDGFYDTIVKLMHILNEHSSLI